MKLGFAGLAEKGKEENLASRWRCRNEQATTSQLCPAHSLLCSCCAQFWRVHFSSFKKGMWILLLPSEACMSLLPSLLLPSCAPYPFLVIFLLIEWVMWKKEPIALETLTSLSWFLPHSQFSFWPVQICRDAAIFCFSQRIGSQAAVPTSQKMREPNLGCLEAWSCLPRPFWDSCKGPGSGWDEEGIHFGYKI